MFRSLFLVFFLIFSNATSAAPVKLIDALLSESGISRILREFSISSDIAGKVQRNVNLSLKSLSFTEDIPSKTQIKNIINSISGSNLDHQYRDRLTKLLDSPVDQLSKDDVVNAVNDLIYLANRFGNSESAVLGCVRCVTDDLDTHGFRFTLNKIQDQNSQMVMSNIVPDKPREVRKYISTQASQYKIGDYSKAPITLIPPEEEKSLALMLGLYKLGNKKQKELIESIFEALRNSQGKIDFFNPDNPHKFHLLFSEEMDDEYMDYWILTLRNIKAERQDNDLTTKEAFFRILERQAGDSAEGQKHIEMLRGKKCFFP